MYCNLTLFFVNTDENLFYQRLLFTSKYCVTVMMFNAYFNNILVISWRSVLLAEVVRDLSL